MAHNIRIKCMVVTVPAPGKTLRSIQFGLLKRNGATHSQSQETGRASLDVRQGFD
ncbi:hypothetical protein [Rhizobium leguminosarum]|uniref:hypothetical protein n=1 Tax=Rhizobium leguminosarum TaxID=384 RepID=UPI001C90C65A|nr:hypothetical protein [Rhizobium leguminosarum]MBY2919480.1 hypothetical protein [Rhizobium leguminosarum]MBY2975087.1 hypothetical protein [Rhizobium leguminosarum]MBY2981820.1 hypothetical protein [Rhizobium leguminosarum]MBY3011035.1 hypothetical protein [Rhizobium leguminosarum]